MRQARLGSWQRIGEGIDRTTRGRKMAEQEPEPEREERRIITLADLKEALAKKKDNADN